MSSEVVIRALNISKRYHLYDKPGHRLRQFVVPRLQALLGIGSKVYYREFWALKDVSFEIRRGETVGIVGRNGSGKSTLLQIICGTLMPSGGGVQISGRVAALLELGAGFNPEFTGRENVFLNGALLGMSPTDIQDRFEAIAAFADIGGFIDQPVRSYSSGMIVRLAFGVIANVDADVLIIDEALAVGDAFFVQKCMRFLRDFQKRGTLIFVSHDSAAVTALCERAVWLEEGEVRLEGAAHEVVEAYLTSEHARDRWHVSGQDVMRIDGSRQRQRSDIDTRIDIQRKHDLLGTINVFEFNPDHTGMQFGAGGASIDDVAILDAEGGVCKVLHGGENTVLSFLVCLREPLERLIFGFYIKDRLGQRLFGDNTFLQYMDDAINGNAGDRFRVQFEFRMPILPSGSYMVDVAVAAGSQDDHTQQHWIHDALEFQATDSTMRIGLVGIPMARIQVDKLDS